ncbi:Zinc finger, FYVE/PHD-type [Sesbania bispinosa]|nr:Zinc finger, FYVE/PHD-type [Sesbania bispinosa]
MRNTLMEIPDNWICESCRSENGTTSLQLPKEQNCVPQHKVREVIPTKKAQTLDRQIEKPTKGAYGALSARKSLSIVGSGATMASQNTSEQSLSVPEAFSNGRLTASIPEQPKSKRPKATPTKSATSKATQRKDTEDSSQSSESTPQANVEQLSESSFEPEQIPLKKKKKSLMKLDKGNEKQKENKKDKGDDEEQKETSSDEEAQTPPAKGTPRPVPLNKKKTGASQVEACDICGFVVWPGLIVTFSKCNIILEHCYCMRNNLTEIPNYWLCESCRSENEPTKEHKSLSQQQIGAVIPTKKAQTLDPQIEKPTKGACGALSARKYLAIVGSGDILGVVAESNKSNIGKSNLQSIQKNLHRRHKYLPSSIPSWRGRFQILQATASGEFYAEFEARSPCIVNTNAHNFSTTMPSVLQLESLPAMNVLTDVFGNDSPSLQDIALSRKKLNSVLISMNAEKSMLRSYIHGVELLVFTSNHLNMDSRDFIDKVVNGEHFLWGVFRHNKLDKAIERLPDMEPVDMDIDMIGEKDAVERIDHVQKDKPKSLSDWSLEGTHLQSTSRKVEEKTLITSSHLKKLKSELSSDPFLWNSVKEYSEYLEKLDVPPGFERHTEKYSGKTAVNEEKPM